MWTRSAADGAPGELVEGIKRQRLERYYLVYVVYVVYFDSLWIAVELKLG